MTMLLRLLPVLTLLLAACGSRSSNAPSPVAEGYGPNPMLPAPRSSLIPTVNVANAKGWPAGTKPDAHGGLAVSALATGLDHPRWLHVLPNGDILVAETNAPPRPDDNKGIRGWFFTHYQKKAGAAVPSANRITLLRDENGDGVVDVRSEFLTGLNSPFGMAHRDGYVYVANTDAVVRFPYSEGQTKITASAEKVADLPAGTLNHHWTKGLILSPDGSKLYASVGSNSNIAENGLDKEEGRAAIWEIDIETRQRRVYASGLRNPVGMDFHPESRQLWTVVNERDELGDNLVPDYLTSVKDGAFYGWPFSYFGKNVDTRVEAKRPGLVASAVVPDYALGAHTASLGLAFAPAASQLDRLGRGAIIGQHGSWNREPRSGYKVIFVPFLDGKPSGMPVDVLTGFLTAEGEARGRPVGVVFDSRGALLVADDVGNVIWRVTR